MLLLLSEDEDIAEATRERDDGNIAFVVRKQCEDDMFVVTRDYIKRRGGNFAFENKKEQRTDVDGWISERVERNQMSITIFNSEIVAVRERVLKRELKNCNVARSRDERSSDRVRVEFDVSRDDGTRCDLAFVVQISDGMVSRLTESLDPSFNILVKDVMKTEEDALVCQYIDRYLRVVELLELALGSELRGLKMIDDTRLPKRSDLKEFLEVVVGISGDFIMRVVRDDFSLMMDEDEFVELVRGLKLGEEAEKVTMANVDEKV
jgi:hypothetical protein